MTVLLAAVVAVIVLRLIDVIDHNQPIGVHDEPQEAGVIEKIGSAVIKGLSD